MTNTKHLPGRRRPAGIALPVVLVILVLMLVGGIYLLKSVHSTGLTTGNLAYDATLGREADLGLHMGFRFLSTTSAASRVKLEQDDKANGYHASLGDDLTPRTEGFWAGSVKFTQDDGTTIEYVIHRMCNQAGAYDSGIYCTQTAANTASLGNTTPLGSSLATDTAQYAGAPRIHYVVTSRISGGRGASVMNQLIVLIGA
jgi:Tfp pilus assembly protein PilX